MAASGTDSLFFIENRWQDTFRRMHFQIRPHILKPIKCLFSLFQNNETNILLMQTCKTFFFLCWTEKISILTTLFKVLLSICRCQLIYLSFPGMMAYIHFYMLHSHTHKHIVSSYSFQWKLICPLMRQNIIKNTFFSLTVLFQSLKVYPELISPAATILFQASNSNYTLKLTETFFFLEKLKFIALK